jgi:RsiW-degrading membrane proteinase PrsW (M82 family)
MLPKINDIKPSSKLPAFAPLAVCLIGFGWFMLLVLPDREFTGLGYIAFLLLAAGGIAFSGLSAFFLVRRLSFPNETLQELVNGFVVVFLFTAILYLPIVEWLVPKFLEFKGHPGGRGGILIEVWRAILWTISLGRSYADASDPGERFFGMFVGVALLEELTKVAPAAYLAYKATGREQSIRNLVIVVALACGFGFGAAEALFWYSPWGGMSLWSLNVARWFLLVPIHGLWAAISAAVLWNQVPSMRKAKTNWGRFGYLIISVCLSAGLHSAHNTFGVMPIFGIAITLGTLWIFKVFVLSENSASTSSDLSALPQDQAPPWDNILTENPRQFFVKTAGACFGLVIFSGIFTSTMKSSSGASSSHMPRELHRVPCSECYGFGRILGPLLGPDGKPLICPVCKGKRYELLP